MLAPGFLSTHSAYTRRLPSSLRVAVFPFGSHHGAVFPHGWQHLPQHLRQHLLVISGRVGHQVMQRLMHAANIVGRQARRHRLDALALPRNLQPGAVVLQRCVPVSMPHGVRQAVHICREALLLWAWSGEV